MYQLKNLNDIQSREYKFDDHDAGNNENSRNHSEFYPQTEYNNMFNASAAFSQRQNNYSREGIEYLQGALISADSTKIPTHKVAASENDLSFR